MKAVGIVGHKNSGKTTLARALAQELAARRYEVVAIKHSLHKLDLRGKDTARLGEFASLVGFISPQESGILWKDTKSLEEIIPYVEADFLLLEGFKGEGTFPKIVCLRGEPEDKSLFDGLTLCAVGPAHQVEGVDVPFLHGEEVGKITDLVEERAFKLPNLNCGACGHQTCRGLALEIVAGSKTIEDCVSLHPTTQVRIEGRPMPMNPFISKIVRSTILGLLSPLKGFGQGEIEIRI